MEMTALVVVQWLHVLAGMVWAGMQVAMAVAIWPMLVRMPAPEARATLAGVGRKAGPIVRAAGMLVLLLGLIRATALGPVRSLHVLFGTPYGWTFLATLGLVVAVMAATGGPPERTVSRIWSGDALRPDAHRFLARKSALTLSLIAGIVACMVLMRFGL
jgi:uncharacterized membrane protein